MKKTIGSGGAGFIGIHLVMKGALAEGRKK